MIVEYFNEKIEVFEDGKIYWNEKERTPYINNDGYKVVSIKTNKGWRAIQVSRLIALAFIPNPNNFPEINHKDYDRQNNSISNLEWVTHKDNIRYSVKNRPNLHGENNPNYGNRKLSKFYSEHPDIAKQKQSRKGMHNGRYKHGKYVKEGATTNP